MSRCPHTAVEGELMNRFVLPSMCVFLALAVVSRSTVAQPSESFRDSLARVLENRATYPDADVISDWVEAVERELAAADATPQQYAEVLEGVESLRGDIVAELYAHELRLRANRELLIYEVRQYLALPPIDPGARAEVREQLRPVVRQIVADAEVIFGKNLASDDMEQRLLRVLERTNPFDRRLARPVDDQTLQTARASLASKMDDRGQELEDADDLYHFLRFHLGGIMRHTEGERLPLTPEYLAAVESLGDVLNDVVTYESERMRELEDQRLRRAELTHEADQIRSDLAKGVSAIDATASLEEANAAPVDDRSSTSPGSGPAPSDSEGTEARWGGTDVWWMNGGVLVVVVVIVAVAVVIGKRRVT